MPTTSSTSAMVTTDALPHPVTLSTPNAVLAATIAAALVTAGLIKPEDEEKSLNLMTNPNSVGMGWRELLEGQLVSVAATAPLAAQ